MHLWFSHNYSNRPKKTCFYSNHFPPTKAHFLSRNLWNVSLAQKRSLLNWFHLVENYDGMILSNWETMTQSTSLLAWPTLWKIRNCNILQILFTNFSGNCAEIFLKNITIFKKDVSYEWTKERGMLNNKKCWLSSSHRHHHQHCHQNENQDEALR